MPRLQHVSLMIPDGTQEQVRAFYGGLLGFTEKQIPKALEHLKVVWFVAGEDELEIHFAPNPILPHPEDQRHICLAVEDVEDYRRRLVEAGYKPIEAVAIPNRPRFFCRDPLGNLLEFATILGDYRDAE